LDGLADGKQQRSTVTADSSHESDSGVANLNKTWPTYDSKAQAL